MIATKSAKGSILNACYNPDFAKQFTKQLIPYVPLWTGIMRSHFKRGGLIATSASVESAFNDLKNKTFKGQLPIRPDKFVLQHLDALDGQIKLASTPNDLPVDNLDLSSPRPSDPRSSTPLKPRGEDLSSELSATSKYVSFECGANPKVIDVSDDVDRRTHDESNSFQMDEPLQSDESNKPPNTSDDVTN